MSAKAKQRDIFISYRREDGYLFAHVLAKTLAQQGYSVFYDRTELVAGSVFPQELTHAVTECRDFVAVVSPMYLGAKKDGNLRIDQEHDWVRKEIALALAGGKNVMPVVIDSKLQQDQLYVPQALEGFKNHNFITFDSEMLIDDFITLLEKGFSEETIKHQKYHAFLQELYEVSDERDNDFNIKIRNLIMKYSENIVDDTLLPLIQSQEETEDVCFAAYYAAFTFYRRLGYVYKIHQLVDRFNSRFYSYRFNNVIMSQHYSKLFELDERKPENLLKAVQYAQAALEKIPGNSGVMQNYADLITRSYELGVNKDKNQLEQAVCYIQEALKINPGYPKYHCTLGRLLSFQNRYHEAVVSIQRAISLENMETKDSFIRIVEYNKYIFDVKLRHLQKKLTKKFLVAVGAMLCFVVLAMITAVFIIRWGV